jgi:hypothetical protein
MEQEEQQPEVKPEPEIIEVDTFNWIIPECCREGWESCQHVPKRDKKVKQNIGL